MRRLSIAALTLTATTLHAAPPEKVRWGDLLAPDRIVQQFAQFGLNAARTFVYLTYEDLSVDLRSGTVTLSEARLRPYPEGHPNAGCEIAMGRLRLTGTPLDIPDQIRIGLVAESVAVPLDCAPQEVLPFAAAAGINGVDADVIRLSAVYDMPSGALRSEFQADFPTMISLSGEADFDYVSIQATPSPYGGMGDPLPMADLSRAQIVIEDKGLWDSATRMLPPDSIKPDSMAFAVSQTLSDTLMDWNGPNEPLSAAQRDFVTQAAEAARRIPQGPRELVLTLAPDPAPLRLSAYQLEAMPFPDVFEALSPALRLGTIDTQEVIPVALLRQALSAPDALDPEARRAVGLALLHGEGAPRNARAALDLLGPLTGAEADPSGALALDLARAETDLDPAGAYTMALRAAQRGAPGALSLADRIEKALPMAQVVALQPPLPELTEAATRRADLASRARAALIGRPVTRSYAQAVYWSELALAAGDSAGRAIADEIDAKMRNSGFDDWPEMRAQLRARALNDWIGSDLPARLSSE